MEKFNVSEWLFSHVINPASGKTRNEEMILQLQIGGSLPSDNAPAYKAKIRKMQREVLKHTDDETFLSKKY